MSLLIQLQRRRTQIWCIGENANLILDNECDIKKDVSQAVSVSIANTCFQKVFIQLQQSFGQLIAKNDIANNNNE